MKQQNHWQDSANVIMGGWLVFSPLTLGFQHDTTALVNVVVVGILLIATALGAIFVPHAWEEWTESALGLWLAVSPWLLGFDSQPAVGNAIMSGLIVLTLALWSLQDFESEIEQTAAH